MINMAIDNKNTLLGDDVVKDVGFSNSGINDNQKSPAYPYGLRITLDKDSLKKMNINKMPEVGSFIDLCAKAKVVSLSEDEQFGDKSVTLQIVEMDFESPEQEKKEINHSEVLYNSQGQQKK